MRTSWTCLYTIRKYCQDELGFTAPSRHCKYPVFDVRSVAANIDMYSTLLFKAVSYKCQDHREARIMFLSTATANLSLLPHCSAPTLLMATLRNCWTKTWISLERSMARSRARHAIRLTIPTRHSWTYSLSSFVTNYCVQSCSMSTHRLSSTSVITQFTVGRCTR